jgi:hypothetical protein
MLVVKPAHLFVVRSTNFSRILWGYPITSQNWSCTSIRDHNTVVTFCVVKNNITRNALYSANYSGNTNQLLNSQVWSADRALRYWSVINWGEVEVYQTRRLQHMKKLLDWSHWSIFNLLKKQAPSTKWMKKLIQLCRFIDLHFVVHESKVEGACSAVKKMCLQFKCNPLFFGLAVATSSVTRSLVPGWTHLRVHQMSSCGGWDRRARSRLPTLERGRGLSWEPRD